MKKIYLILILAVLAVGPGGCGGSSTPAYGLKMISSSGGGTLYLTTTPEGNGHIKVAKLSGTFAEMGRQYGALLKTDLTNFYQSVVNEYLIGEKGHSYNDLLAIAQAAYDAALAETKEFMQGIAETSGLSLSQLELINYSMLAAIAGCSAVAAWGEHTGGGPLVVGRNWDMAADTLTRFKDYMMVVVYDPPTGNSLADINYMGQFQFLQSAMNEKGLWIDLQDGHMSSSLKDSTKQDANMGMFEFLRNDSTMEEFDSSFMAVPVSSSFVMTAASPDVAYSYFWCTQGTYRFTEPDESGLLVTSNHFVEYPSTWTVDPLPADPAAQGYTEIRRNNWLALANSETYNGKLTDETMKTMFETTIPNGGGTFPGSEYGVQTTYQIVAVPQELRIWIRMPDHFGWEKIELGELFE